MLWTDVGPHFVDLEDCRMGPAIPDLWMMLSGNRSERALQLATPREGDATFHALDPRELARIEPLRALCMIHLRRLALAPLGRPRVPLAFLWFGTPQYWQDHVGSLEVQLAAWDEPALPLLWLAAQWQVVADGEGERHGGETQHRFGSDLLRLEHDDLLRHSGLAAGASGSPAGWCWRAPVV
jgi:hypothetical protein